MTREEIVREQKEIEYQLHVVSEPVPAPKRQQLLKRQFELNAMLDSLNKQEAKADSGKPKLTLLLFCVSLKTVDKHVCIFFKKFAKTLKLLL